jgi:alkanesulfonate monooxygenase SsuD/methylene tetrahydromethanopterin reductase-like flavin-dependent oxidoreductase (luciferase family)
MRVMRCGIVLTTADPLLAADLAAEAEAAGWDGVFTYDAVAIGDAAGFDPWVLLAAMSMRTERVTLGAMVFAPARQRPWNVARSLATLDRLSGGRVVFPVGLGALDDKGWGNVGEPVDARTRARRLDETLAIIDGLSSGEPFAFEGEHYRFGQMTFRPTPVQRPRVPVWVIGAWPSDRSMRRAARWDGVIVQVVEEGTPTGTPSDLATIVEWIRRERTEAGLEGPFEIVVGGTTPADDPASAWAAVATEEAAGATWWMEQDWEDTSVDALRARIAAGPPRARGR